MAAFCVSMTGLVGFLVVAGIGLGALATGSELYSAALFSLTVLILLDTLMMAVYAPRRKRPFWAALLRRAGCS